MLASDQHALIKELRILSRLDNVRGGVPGLPYHNSSPGIIRTWEANTLAALKKIRKARDKYGPRALAALDKVRAYSEAGNWHPSQGTLERWEEALGWARLPPIDPQAGLADAKRRFDEACTQAYRRGY